MSAAASSPYAQRDPLQHVLAGGSTLRPDRLNHMTVASSDPTCATALPGEPPDLPGSLGPEGVAHTGRVGLLAHLLVHADDVDRSARPRAPSIAPLAPSVVTRRPT